jgi:hypothetical protein
VVWEALVAKRETVANPARLPGGLGQETAEIVAEPNMENGARLADKVGARPSEGAIDGNRRAVLGPGNAKGDLLCHRL